jgi:hypothetical protein
MTLIRPGVFTAFRFIALSGDGAAIG